MQLMNRLVPVALTLLPVAAAAQTTGVLATKRPMTWGIIFALLFLMLGPIKLLGPFAAATKNSDRVFRFHLATRAFLFAIAAVTIAAGLGTRILANFAIPVLVLQIAAGLILFLVALQAVMDKPVPRPGAGEVLVRLKAATLNYRDLLTIKGGYRSRSKFPLVPVSDGAGIVGAVGSNVRLLSPGDRAHRKLLRTLDRGNRSLFCGDVFTRS